MMSGWLPADISLDPQPSAVPEALVRWVEVGSTPLAEPFFEHTLDMVRKALPAAREMDTDIETMLRVAGRVAAVRPAGFIFHLSHCGSTLIANALKKSERAVVVSESRALSSALRSRSAAVSPYLRERWEPTRRAVLNALFSLFAHYRTGEPAPLVIKFVSIDILCMELLRSYWPDVPCVVVIRDPAEIMVTTLRIDGWMRFQKHPERACELFGWKDLTRPVATMIREEFCARVLGSFCTSALAAMARADAGKCMIVDYVDLSPQRMRDIAAFFGIELIENGKAIDEVFETYAKDPDKAVPFQDDRELKQRLATVLVRSAANQFAMDSYGELSKWRRAQR
jgi:hypothetical protein